jgi:adenylate cyclase
VTEPVDTTAVIAFTDIVGFTEFTATRGDAEALVLLDLQAGIVRETLPADARVVKELGDGLMLWFADAVSAVRTGLDLLGRFTDVAHDDAPLWVRMGMHRGTPTPRGDDFVGHDVNVAARITDAAGPGELLVSADTCDALDAALPEVCLDELGPVVMRGLPEPVRLFRASRAAGG